MELVIRSLTLVVVRVLDLCLEIGGKGCVCAGSTVVVGYHFGFLVMCLCVVIVGCLCWGDDNMYVCGRSSVTVG